MIVHAGKECRFAEAEQWYWGTPGETFYEVLAESVAIDYDFKEFDSKANWGYRHQDAGAWDISSASAAPKISISNVIPTNGQLAKYLYAFMQSVTEGAATPFSKVFVWPQTQPDFTNNVGYFFTFIVHNPINNSSERIKDCVCSKLNLKVSPGGIWTLNADFIGRGAVVMTAQLTGNPIINRVDLTTDTGSPRTANYWRYEDIDRLYVYYDLVTNTPTVLMGDIELNLEQDVVPCGQSVTDAFSTFYIGNRRGQLKMKVNWDDSPRAARANLIIGEPLKIRIGHGNATPGTDNRDFDIVVAGQLKKADIVRGEDILTCDLELDIRASLTDSLIPISITTADGSNRVW